MATGGICTKKLLTELLIAVVYIIIFHIVGWSYQVKSVLDATEPADY
jgi:hypothetical protein